ncbi:MAG: GAF domain-containing protein, partial [Chloroflexi bacterium]
MKREITNRLIVWLLAITTIVTLLTNPPQQETFTQYSQWFAVYSLLTAFALYFSVIMSEAELSPAHVIGIIAFLSLPHRAQDTMTWAVFIGSIVGGLVLLVRAEARRLPRRLAVKTVRGVVVMTARVTLSFYAAGQLYSALGGTLPLEQLSAAENVIPLVAFSVLYILFYLAIFVLESYSEGRSIERLLTENIPALFTVLVLPVPFAVLAAEVFNSQATSQASFILLSTGLVLIIISLHGLSRAQHQLQRQIDELRSLSVISQTMGAKLDLVGLLNVIYLQVAELLDIENFQVAIYNESDKKLHFPITIRNRKQQPTPTPVEVTGKSLIHHVFKTGRPLLIPRDVNDTARRMGIQAPPTEQHSWMGVPLIAGGRTLGVMAVDSQQAHQHFNSDNLRLLNIIAGNASVALDNVQFYEQQAARVEQLVSMNEVLSQLTGTLSPDIVLDRIIIAASTISSASAIAVYLFWDEAHSTLALARSTGLSDRFLADPIEPIIKDALIRMQKTKTVAHDLPPFSVEDVHSDSRTPHLRHLMAQEKKTAWIELPLGLGDEYFGVLVLYYDEAHPFSPEAVELLRTFTNQVAQAINNARVYTRIDEALERRVNQLVALATAGHELTVTMNLRMITDLVLNHAISATHADRGALVLCEDDGELKLYAHQGYPDGTFTNRAIIKQGITGRIFKTGKLVFLGNVAEDHDYLPLMPTTRSQLSVPILRGDETEGVITLESNNPDAFS